MPVVSTAFFAATFDFPSGLPASSVTVIPVFVYFQRIITKLAKPAPETARNVKKVRAMRYAPGALNFAIQGANIRCPPRLMAIDSATAEA